MIIAFFIILYLTIVIGLAVWVAGARKNFKKTPTDDVEKREKAKTEFIISLVSLIIFLFLSVTTAVVAWIFIGAILHM